MEQRALRPGAAQHLGLEAIIHAIDATANAIDIANSADATEAHPAARLRRLAGAQMQQHLVVRQHALDERFDRAAARLHAVQARLDDARVVEHQQVAGVQQRRQVAERAVDGLIAATIQQPRAAALRCRLLGDEFGGQGEVEIAQRMVCMHGLRA